MAENCFSLATKSMASKRSSAKSYLKNDKKKTDEEILVIFEEIKTPEVPE